MTMIFRHFDFRKHLAELFTESKSFETHHLGQFKITPPLISMICVQRKFIIDSGEECFYFLFLF